MQDSDIFSAVPGTFELPLMKQLYIFPRKKFFHGLIFKERIGAK